MSQAVDMDSVYDDVLRLADEFNTKLTSFTALLSGGFIAWLLLVLVTAAAGLTSAFHATLTSPFALLFLGLFASARGDIKWYAATGENIMLHCTGTALCAALCSVRPLRIAALAQKDGELWRHIVGVVAQSTAENPLPQSRIAFALNRLMTESIRQSALDA